jgi:hypothetical protein
VLPPTVGEVAPAEEFELVSRVMVVAPPVERTGTRHTPKLTSLQVSDKTGLKPALALTVALTVSLAFAWVANVANAHTIAKGKILVFIVKSSRIFD